MTDSRAEPEVRRLGWAGVSIACQGHTLFIDPLASPDLWGGAFAELLVPIEPPAGERRVLVTHLHGDHFDEPTLRRLLGERDEIVCSERVAGSVASRGFRVRAAALWEPVGVGPLTVTALPAVDGFGIDQVSWLVRAGDARIVHCGDTLWHGHWWDIRRHLGADADLVFLPINGFRYQGRAPDVRRAPASLTPEQAVDAARVLGARRLVPIHYGLSAPFYEEEARALERLQAAAAEEGIAAPAVAPGGDVG